MQFNDLLAALPIIPGKKLTTADLFNLRYEKFEQTGLTDSMIQKCKDLKAEYQSIQRAEQLNFDNKYDDTITALLIFRKLWQLLSTLDINHMLYTPPIYETEAITSLLKEIVFAIRLRECKYEVIASGHPILSGVKGTGKTTLVKAIAIAVAICSPTYFLAYIDLKTEIYINKLDIPTPYSIAINILLLLNPHYNIDEIKLNMDLHKLLQALKIHKFQLGIILDEVQLIYILDAPRAHDSISTLYQYYDFAENYICALLILTGSSTSLRNLLTKYDRSDRLANYSYLSDDVGTFYSVSALRCEADLVAYINHRYPTYDLTASNSATRILHSTGGIGRHIHEYVASIALPPYKALQDVENKTEFLIFLNILLREKNELSEIILKSNNIHVGDDTTPLLILPSMVSMSLDTAGKYMTDQFYIANPHKLFIRWTDLGYLYTEADTIQLARPGAALTYYRGCGSAMDSLCVLLIYTMMTKPECRLNAGFTLEDMVRPRISALRPDWKSKFVDDSVEIGQHNALIVRFAERDSNISRSVTLSDNTIAEIDGRVFKWDKELGLDAVYISVDSAHKRVSLHLWQCKGGYSGGKGLGMGSLDTYRQSESKKNDDMLTSIIVRAERGAFLLTDAILTSLPGWFVQIESLLITTTKSLDSMLEN